MMQGTGHLQEYANESTQVEDWWCFQVDLAKNNPSTRCKWPQGESLKAKDGSG